MTRQFNIDPRLLCKQHLLGEHSEMHEGVGLITCDHAKDNPNWLEAVMGGQARAGNIDTSWFEPRHEVLVSEMQNRGYNHESPLEYDDSLELGLGAVDWDESAGTLMKCDGCRPRIMAAFTLTSREEWDEDENENKIPPTAWYPDRPLSEHPFAETLDAIACFYGDERQYRDGLTASDIRAVGECAYA